ncbi:MAG: peptidoglycan DD-metalloendopeptidase family protein [Deltaproteobacteria bacterium]|nr:peptidoglycan DD-metalloendopeptidase family protein [Deltaproteobacteria bacterium]
MIKVAFSIGIAVGLLGFVPAVTPTLSSDRPVFFGWFEIKAAQCQEEENKKNGGQLLKEKSELEKLQKRIADKKIQIQTTKKKEKKVLSELDEIEKMLSQKQAEHKNYVAKLEEKKQEIERLNDEHATLQSVLMREEKELAYHVRTLYKISRLRMPGVFFSSDSLGDVMRINSHMIRVVDYSVRSVDAYSESLEKVQKNKEFLNQNEKNLTLLIEKTDSTHRQILHHKKGKTDLLAKIKTEKEIHLEALEELKQASRRLQVLIDQLEQEIKADTIHRPRAFPVSKNKLSFPVAGSIITHFGKHEDPAFSTISFNNGIEILAQTGSAIHAVFEGSVIYAGWFKGYGNIIIIDHGDGYYTLSGHASELFKRVGDQVEEGETIGLVGETGSLKGPNLYFEIRHHGQPLDPLTWLQKNK